MTGRRVVGAARPRRRAALRGSGTGRLVRLSDAVGGRRQLIAVFGFVVLVMAVAGVGFAYKMGEFVLTIVHDEIAGFGAVAVATYLVGMMPILFITLWAVMTGRFRDVEAPKFRIFELEREIDRGGELERSGSVTVTGVSHG